ncbi:MAG: hypothetical protein GY820_21050 [Gammaproteobacteria bacterium]|nr:hypothetical protein [Gammaproteobacteria bacterium]
MRNPVRNVPMADGPLLRGIAQPVGHLGPERAPLAINADEVEECDREGVGAYCPQRFLSWRTLSPRQPRPQFGAYCPPR